MPGGRKPQSLNDDPYTYSFDDSDTEDVEISLRAPLLDRESEVGKGISAVEDTSKTPVSFLDLFTFADRLDWCFLAWGSFCSIGVGIVSPIFSLVLGGILDAFNGEKAEEHVNQYTSYFVYLAIASFVLNASMNSCFTVTSERQMRKMREAYLSAALRQEIGWFDSTEPGQLGTRLKGDTLVIQEGIGLKLGRLFQFGAQFVSGFAVGFSRGWQLSLVMLTCMPFLVAAILVLVATVKTLAARTRERTGEAGAVAQEVIGSMRTVSSFNGEARSVERYKTKLELARDSAIAASMRVGASLGFMLFTIFCSYALGMAYGAKEVADGIRSGCTGSSCLTGGDVLTVFWSVLQGAMAIGQCGPNISALAEARGAASHLLQVYRRKPSIDAMSSDGLSPTTPTLGKLELRNVTFAYPARPNKDVLINFNLVIEAGTTVALVGASGSGKSTVISLLERFYDPSAGSILLDGRNIKELNIQWLRTQLGLVSQEPVLFSTTIAENIAYGKEGATFDEVRTAAKLANAYDFIMDFPDGFETAVGDKGIQMSGGQKQRIAIARAILRDPAVLCLDEATSALDTASERIVQDALDRLLAQRHRTTVVIAHRLSTVRSADKIVVVENGAIVEQGSHNELMGRAGSKYSHMVELQFQPNEKAANGTHTGARQTDPIAEHVASISIRSASSASTSKEDTFGTNGHINGNGTSTSAIRASATSDHVPAKPARVERARLWRLMAAEKGNFFLALCAGLVNGAVFPLFALILSRVISFLYLPDPDEVQRKAGRWSLFFVALAAAVACSTFVQLTQYTIMGEKLTARLRLQTFEAIVRQDMAYFDDKENGTGALTTRLATEATLVKNIAGQNMGRVFQSMVTVILALAVAIIFGDWRLTLIVAAVQPILILCSRWQMISIRKSTTQSQDSTADAGNLAVQAFEGVRTVHSFNLVGPVIDLYHKALEDPLRQGIKRGVINALSLGISQLLMLLAFGLVFWYGGHLVLSGEITFNRMLVTLMSVMMAATGVAQTSSFLGDSGSAEAAAVRIFAVMDRRPEIDSSRSDGAKLPTVAGRLELRGVHFRYPSRPDAPVLVNFNLVIEPGTTVALVGASGSGKSTVISLLERFYDPDAGSILLDGRNIKELNLQWLRRQLGLVSQEPILFSTSIAENIAYGKEGATFDEVCTAAKLANAYDFIMDFPDGFETPVGEKGIQMSGGQKQRIAIARAILRDPAVLCLDEATSALDTASERIVQDALDRLLAQRHRTTVVIAHRLSTVRSADKIVVVENGAIVEQGSHNELSSIRNGRYLALSQGSEYSWLAGTAS